MNIGSYPLAGGMISNLNKLDKIANNMANLNTNGYKESSPLNGSFNNYLDQAKKNGDEANTSFVTMNTIPKISGEFTDTKVGNIEFTNNDLDFAITKENAFFKLMNPNGEVVLSRDGAFKIQDSMLVNKDGLKVLNTNSEQISTNNENFKSQIALIESDFNNLKRIGDNNYKILDSDKIKESENPQNHISNSYLEKSNINIVESMVAMIDAQRSYEQMQKGLHSINELDQESLKIGTTKV
jgi:flagellar basal-body rod protein FlgG